MFFFVLSFFSELAEVLEYIYIYIFKEKLIHSIKKEEQSKK